MTKPSRARQAAIPEDDAPSPPVENNDDDHFPEEGGDVPPDETPEPDPDAQPQSEDQLEKMKKQVAQANRERDAARAKAAKLTQENAGHVQTSQSQQEQALNVYEGAVDKAIEAENAKMENLLKDLEAAHADGDYKKVAETNRKIARCDNVLMANEGEKQRIEVVRQNMKNAPARPEAASPTYTDAAQSWIDAHPQFQTNEDGSPANDYTEEAIAAHHVAVTRGIKQDSPEYFKLIEGRLKKNGYEDEAPPATGHDDSEPEEEPAPPPRKPAPRQSTAAPPSRSGGQPPPTRAAQGAKKLTAEELSAAEMSDQTPDEYWEEKYGKNSNKKR